MEELIKWVNEQLTRRGWSQAELARRADISPGALSLMMNQERGAGPELCTGLAKALDVPPEYVFRLAGILPHRETRAALISEILFYFDRMEEDDQLKLIRIAWSLSQEQPENEPIHGPT